MKQKPLEVILRIPAPLGRGVVNSCSGVPGTEYSHWAVLAESTDPTHYKKVSDFLKGRVSKSTYKEVATENNGAWVTYLVLSPYTPEHFLTKIEEICIP